VTAARGTVPAYQLLAEALRKRILDRELAPGEKLPVEPDLSAEYGVSRSTVREALRVLTSQNLVTTTRGMSGGSFVAYPKPEQISNYLEASLGLLALSEDVPVDALLEARDMLEVPAAGLAAARRSATDLERMRHALFDPAASVDTDRLLEHNRAFHMALLRATGNPLVDVLARAVYGVLNGRFLHARATPTFWSQVVRDHRLILAAVEAGDAAAASSATQSHLGNLRPTYKRFDRTGVRS
jgi:GntR family transcriptional repressor for pyruvate dehydrogenase complex